MNLAWIIAVSIALGADAFSLALAIGLVGVDKRMIFRLSILVAIFHVFMPLFGMLIGQTLGMVLGRLAKGIGALVLVWLGFRMLQSLLRPRVEYYSFTDARKSIFRKHLPSEINLQGIGLYALIASVSLDALSVGFSLGTVGNQIGLTVFVMGIVAGIMTGAGLIMGQYLGTKAGKKAELFGGLTLVLIGFKLFF